MSFQFKQFRIAQDRCAQKVSEVACIQGAWAHIPPLAKDILDIGSGTALLSLMLAQRTSALIDAIEIEESAHAQGKENVEQSPFANRINCLQGDVRTYPFSKCYDFIICNPPFFQGQLKSNSDSANLAKHATMLSLEELLKVVDRVLKADGAFCILLPLERMSSLNELAASFQLFPKELLLIRHTAQHTPGYFVGIYSSTKAELRTEELCIRENGQHSPLMKELVKDYYL
jgi:tRNA1Val (adenine37-N6)-methyltransferase